MTEQSHTRHNTASLSWIEKEAKKDRMRLSERGGEIIAMMIIGLIALFFYTHQTQATGFFTSSFGLAEASLFYGSLLAGIVGPLVRLTTGRRNTARPSEMLASLFWIASSVWLLTVFPFNFAHFGDVLPSMLKFLVNWITNDIGRLVLVLGVIGGLVSVALNAVLYGSVRSLLRTEQLR